MSDISFISFDDSDYSEVASKISKKYSIPIASPKKDGTYLFISKDSYISFQNRKLFNSFTKGSFSTRIKNFQRENILKKAISFDANKPKKILDSTGGLGHDAFILALLGQKITVIEKNKGLCALFEVSLEDLPSTEYFNRAKENINIVNSDSKKFRKRLKDYDLVYVDPMFKNRGKAGRSGALTLMSQYLDDFSDVSNIFLESEFNKIVVKRQKLFKSISSITPNSVINGKSIDFHIFS